MASKKIVKQWFTYAAKDLKVAKLVLSLGVDYKYTAAFNAQQCVEKAAKGVLVFNDQRPPKTHNLNTLADLLKDKNLKLSKQLRSLDALTDFAVVYRYPDAENVPVSFEVINKLVAKASKFYDVALALVENS